MKNRVIAGEYVGKKVHQACGAVSISTGPAQKIMIDKVAVANYEDIDRGSRKSVSSTIAWAAIGWSRLGPLGLLLGLAGRDKGTHLVALEFRDGKQSMIEIDDRLYGTIV